MLEILLNTQQIIFNTNESYLVQLSLELFLKNYENWVQGKDLSSYKNLTKYQDKLILQLKQELMINFVKNNALGYIINEKILDEWKILNLELFQKVFKKVLIIEKNNLEINYSSSEIIQMYPSIWKLLNHFCLIWIKQEVSEAVMNANLDQLLNLLMNDKKLEKLGIPLEQWYLLNNDMDALQALFKIIETAFDIQNICEFIEIKGTPKIREIDEIIDILIYVYQNKEVFYNQVHYYLSYHKNSKESIEEYFGIETNLDYKNFSYLRNIADVCNILKYHVYFYNKYIVSDKNIVSLLEYFKVLEYWQWGADDTLQYLSSKYNKFDPKLLRQISKYAKLIIDFENKGYSKYEIMRMMHPKKNK